MAGHSSPAEPVSPEIVQERQNIWDGFSRFMLIGIISVLVVLFGFLLHFGTGWGFAVFFMLASYLLMGILMLIGRL